MPPSEAGRRRDAQMSAGLDATGTHARFGAGQLGKQPLTVLQKSAAFMRERQPPGGAQQQLHAEPRLQRVNAPSHHGRRNALGLCGGREAALERHGNKGFDLFEPVHGLIVLIEARKSSPFMNDLCKFGRYSLCAGT